MLAKLGLATDEHGTVIHHFSTQMKLAIDADRVAQFVTDRSRAGQITLYLQHGYGVQPTRVMRLQGACPLSRMTISGP
jgi:hypothetical protein